MSKFIVYSFILILGASLLNCQSSADSSSTTATPSGSLRFNNSAGFTVSSPKDGLTKRNVNDVGQTESAATAKSYDPPPEFYRGPGSTASHGYNSNIHDNVAAGLITKPITFPNHSHNLKQYVQDKSNFLHAAAHDSWQLLKGGGANTAGRHPLQDRISVGVGGHYTSKDHGASGGISTASHSTGSNYGGGHSYPYEGRPYVTASAVGGYGNDYATAPHATNYGGSYYGSGESIAGGGGAIPIDLYGHKGHYAGAGGEYSYSTYPIHVGGGAEGHEQPATHKGHPELSQKALLAKSFLIPLASAAVLGIAAALISNPLLLQLGTVSGVAAAAPGLVGKRRRRALTATGDGEVLQTKNITGLVQKETQQLPKKTHAIAYRGQRGRSS